MTLQGFHEGFTGIAKQFPFEKVYLRARGRATRLWAAPGNDRGWAAGEGERFWTRGGSSDRLLGESVPEFGIPSESQCRSIAEFKVLRTTEVVTKEPLTGFRLYGRSGA
jgi:hypothetical protein